MTGNGRPSTARSESTKLPGNAPADLPLGRGHLLLIGTGSFSVNLLPSWALLLRRWYGCAVRACLTYSASALVSRDALAAATKSSVWGPDFNTAEGCVPHQELAGWADLVVVAPATAAFVGKCAHGISDSLALSVVMATSAPVVIAPALAEVSVTKPSVQRNFALLAEDGYRVVPPQHGTSVHTDMVGPGAMADFGSILRAARESLVGARPDSR